MTVGELQVYLDQFDPNIKIYTEIGDAWLYELIKLVEVHLNKSKGLLIKGKLVR